MIWGFCGPLGLFERAIAGIWCWVGSTVVDLGWWVKLWLWLWLACEGCLLGISIYLVGRIGLPIYQSYKFIGHLETMHSDFLVSFVSY